MQQHKQRLGEYITPEEASKFARTGQQYIDLAKGNGWLLPAGKSRMVTQ